MTDVLEEAVAVAEEHWQKQPGAVRVGAPLLWISEVRERAGEQRMRAGAGSG